MKNLGQDPQNGTLSVYEQGQLENTLVALEITNPFIDGEDFIYHYRIINGTMPANGGPTALFISHNGLTFLKGE